MGGVTRPEPGGSDLARATLARLSWRILPLIGLAYGASYMDRINISFAALQMNADLKFSDTVYGIGGSAFFVSYALLEIPSNLMLAKVGARRWLARIMVTWGVLASAMMFVQTPLQFYVMRFLLGAAEAGFFPGVVYYLGQWFPDYFRSRAISRFYIAFPLSNVFMGAVAGALLNLRGTFGLAGWQWLFLLEGLPPVLLSLAFLKFLPDRPETAPFLSDPQRQWLLAELAQTAPEPQGPGRGDLLRVMTHPVVLMLGVSNLLFLGGNYAFTLSAPRLLKAAVHLDAAGVGYLTAAAGLVGALAMLANSASSDRRGERVFHTALPMMLLAACYAVIGHASAPVLVAGAYLVSMGCNAAMQGVFWVMPSTLLKGRTSAIGLAAINMIGMFGAMLAPALWGYARDQTGNFDLGLTVLPFTLIIAALIVIALRFVVGRRGDPVKI